MVDLARRHRGGMSNYRGNQYELYYSISQVVILLNSVSQEDYSSVFFQAQVPDVYIDDLLIVNAGLKTYHQLKDVANLSFESVKSDFEQQASLSNSLGESFQMKLIYSSLNFSDDGIRLDDFSSEYFPKITSAVSYLQKPELKTALLKLIPQKSEEIHDDRLYGIVVALLGYWIACDATVGIFLDKIYQYLIENGANLLIVDCPELTPECSAILDSIPDFKYEINGGSFNWKTEKSEGNIIWTDDLSAEIIERAPKNFLELFSLL